VRPLATAGLEPGMKTTERRRAARRRSHEERGHHHGEGRRRGGRHDRRQDHQHAEGHHHGGEHHRGRDHLGNPQDLERYLSRLEGPDRRAWQKPGRVVAALGLRPGGIVCDVGTGPGYFALRLARTVGPKGRVYAVDAEPRMLRVLRKRIREQGLGNVRPVLAAHGKAPLPPRRCDLILLVNAFHHFPDGAATLRALAGRLRPGGRIVNVDFHRRRLPVGPPPEHKVPRGAFLRAAREAGLRLLRERRFLPYQYFLELSAAPGKAAGPRARRKAVG